MARDETRGHVNRRNAKQLQHARRQSSAQQEHHYSAKVSNVALPPYIYYCSSTAPSLGPSAQNALRPYTSRDSGLDLNSYKVNVEKLLCTHEPLRYASGGCQSCSWSDARYVAGNINQPSQHCSTQVFTKVSVYSLICSDLPLYVRNASESYTFGACSIGIAPCIPLVAISMCSHSVQSLLWAWAFLCWAPCLVWQVPAVPVRVTELTPWRQAYSEGYSGENGLQTYNYCYCMLCIGSILRHKLPLSISPT